MDSQDIARKTIRQRRRWRWAVRFNILVAVLLAVGLVVLVNALSARLYLRADWSRSNLFALSDQTVRLLEGLTNSVDVIVFFQRGEEIFHDVENLLREYQYKTSLLRVEYVDPDRNLARTEELARLYDIRQPNVLVFLHAGRSHVLTSREIMEYDYSGMRQGVAPVRVRFKGEQAFSSAIYSVTTAERPKVYFLSGHGERRIDNYDPAIGYSSIAKRMHRDNIELDMLLLGETQRIPPDAAALIIAGPTRRIAQPELDLIHTYLDQGGRVMMLIDSLTRTALESVLVRWGVQLGDDIVVDPERTFTGRELFVTEYGMHPITEPVRGVTTIFYTPRSVEAIPRQAASTSDQADKPHVTPLARSSATGWAERDLDQSPMRFDAGVDRSGPVSVAAAVERGPIQGIDVQIRPSRMVVFGDSAFVSNGALTGGDEDFFMSGLNWLLARELMMAIAPKDVETMRLVLTRRQIRQLLGITVGGMPAAIAFLGVLVWLKRRH